MSEEGTFIGFRTAITFFMMIRPVARRSPTEVSRRVLILGTGAAERRIAGRLEALGCSSVLEPEPVLSGLKAVLAKWSGEVEWIHPGTGEMCRTPQLATFAERHGIGVIGPGAKAVQVLSNRIALFSTADRLSIPHPALGLDPIHGIRELLKITPTYPFVLRSLRRRNGVDGGWVVRSRGALEEKFPIWIQEQALNGGEEIVYLEKYIEGARRVQLPFVRARDGRIRFYSPVDVSLQGEKHRWMDLSPAERLDEELVAHMEGWSGKLANHLNYVGAGVLEFRVDGARAFLSDAWPGLENTFPLWEIRGGENVVEDQWVALDGGEWSRIAERVSGAAAALHLSAWDPVRDLPRPGRIPDIRLNNGKSTPFLSAEWDQDQSTGEVIAEGGNGEIGRVFIRCRARSKLSEYAGRVLNEMEVGMDLDTNRNYLMEILASPWVREGLVHQAFLEEQFVPTLDPLPRRAKVIPTRGKGPFLRSLVSGRVHTILYRTGAKVPAQEAAVLVESLGALVAHRVGVAMKIQKWCVKAEAQAQVHWGDVLAEITPIVENK